MKKSYLTIALTLTVVFGAGITALAQDSDRVSVNVPFEFVAGTKTLPAGTYTIDRSIFEVNSGLIIRNHGNGALLFSNSVDNVHGGPPGLSFERVGGKYFLSKIETPERVYNMGPPPEMMTLGAVKKNGSISSAGGK